MPFPLQPILENDKVILYPLNATDFDLLYAVASDPKIWEQHPNRDRYKKEIFQTFFEGAMQSGGAFRIVDKTNGETIGSTRFYDHTEKEDIINIGYTFYATFCWGKGINRSVKKLMLDHAFHYVSKVHFHIGANNIRSQIATGRIGATKIAEQEISYFGETEKLNFIYEICRENYLKK